MKTGILPHYKVYTRIGVSKIHGVGVMAIIPITKGTKIFEFGDEDRGIKISKRIVEDQPEPIKKLYKDFCVNEGDYWYCVSNFNKMTSSYYLNHSNNPNVELRADEEFYALRDIEAGEEITVDYKTLYVGGLKEESAKGGVHADLVENNTGGKGE